MRPRRLLWTTSVLFTLVLTSPVRAQVTPAAAPIAQRAALLSSRQIDRYHAIKQLNAQLKLDPKNLGNWILRGELAQGIASDLPADQARAYYALARESYDNALKLDPDNAGLKAAADFARQHEQNAAKFNQSRAALTNVYLDARRQELAQSNYIPSVPTFGTVPPSATPLPFGADVGQHPAVPSRTLPASPYSYQPFVNAQGQPYTYEQYSRMYAPPGESYQPMTTRGYYLRRGTNVAPAQAAPSAPE
jgi:tetratricopeptide (TPR) repeat protein